MCVIREVEEETGVIVRPLRNFLVMHEYYEEYCYTGYYFVCEMTGKGHMKLTDVEKQRGVQPEWIPLQQGWGENGQCMLKMNCKTGEVSVVMTNQDPGEDQVESGVERLAEFN